MYQRVTIFASYIAIVSLLTLTSLTSDRIFSTCYLSLKALVLTVSYLVAVTIEHRFLKHIKQLVLSTYLRTER